MKKITLMLCLVILTNTLFAQQRKALDKIIGKVDNYYILRSDLEATLAQYADQPQKPSNCQILEQLFIGKLLLAKSEIDSVTVEDKAVDNELTGRMEQMIQRFGNEKNIVEAYGRSLESLKSEMRGQVKDQLINRKMQQTLQSKTTITPNEVKAFFNAIPKDSIPVIPTQVEVGQIVRLAKASKEDSKTLKNRLIDLKGRIEKGEEFSKLAQEFSEDLGSGKQGGDLGWAKRGMMVPVFEATAMQLKPNEMSGVVESEFGYHLIQLIERRGQEYHARHILLRPDYNRLDMTEPTRFLDSLRHKIMADSLKFDKAAKEFSEDKVSNDYGGMIRDTQGGGVKIPFDETMETYLFMTLDSMKVGTFSKPAPYRTEDGKTGVRVLYYKTKHAPHPANLKDDYVKIAEIALSKKKNNAIAQWFKKAKDDVFIYVDEEFKDCKVLEGEY